MISYEIERGREAIIHDSEIRGLKPLPPPPIADILHSVSLNSSVLEHPSFESWAKEYDYNTDSRKAEAIYKACLRDALKAKAFFDLRSLATACEDY